MTMWKEEVRKEKDEVGMWWKVFLNLYDLIVERGVSEMYSKIVSRDDRVPSRIVNVIGSVRAFVVEVAVVS